MRRFIKRVVFFIPLIFIAWVAGVFISGKVFPGFLQKNVRVTYYKNYNSVSLKEIDTVHDIDILIAGPSSAFRSFDPRIFETNNLRIFNMGSSAQSPVQTEYLARKYLQRIHPRLFIYVANVQALASDGVEGWLFLINNLQQYDGEFWEKTLSTKSYYLYSALCYNVANNNLCGTTPYHSKIEKYISSGFVEYVEDAHDTNFYHTAYSAKEYTFPSFQQEAFVRLTKLCRAANVPMLVIQVPQYDGLYNSFSNRAAIDSYFTSFSEMHYINYKDNGYFKKDDFWDAMHLNQHGVAGMDNMIIDSLQRFGYFKQVKQ
jgi:hypothetical protein